MLRFYNSLSRRIEKFAPVSGKAVKIYTCGPTVYARPHIGNYRTYAFEDTVKRHLLNKGYRVRHVMNITDFDNTILRAVRKTGMPRRRLTAIAEREFRRDLRALGAIPAEKYPHASEYAGRMAQAALALLKKGIAYKDESGRVFFDISKYRGYGELYGRKFRSGKRVMREGYFPWQAGDFMLFRPCRKSRINAGCFETALGRGEPAWNVQCAAMSMDCLGSGIDISMGGMDNKFEHHENTRAIVESLTGKPCSKYWLHVRHLTVNGKKMSKSKGNVVMLPDLSARGLSGKAARMLLLSVHYRKRLDFTWERAMEAKAGFARLERNLSLLKRVRRKGGRGCAGDLEFAEESFNAAMDDDFDVPKAISIAGKLAERCAELDSAGKLSGADAKRALALFRRFDSAIACLPL